MLKLESSKRLSDKETIEVMERVGELPSLSVLLRTYLKSILFVYYVDDILRQIELVPPNI